MARKPFGIFLAKYSSASGEHIWSKSFGPVHEQMLKHSNIFALDANDRIIFTSGFISGLNDLGFGSILPPKPDGSYYGGPMVGAVNSDGSPAWAVFLTGFLEMNAVATGSDGRVLTASVLSGPVQTGSLSFTPTGARDMLVLQLTP